MPGVREKVDPTLLVVGAASRDIDPADPRGWRLGGTVNYASLACARLGLRVRALIGVDETAAAAAELETLRSAGVEVELVALRRGPVFENVETPTGRLQYCFGRSDRLAAATLPPAWREPAAVIFGPVAGELDAEWATALPATTLVGLTWQGLLRRLRVGRPVEATRLRRTRLVARADLLAVSSDDARAGGAPLKRLLRPRQELIVTGGARGTLHLRRVAAGVAGWRVPALPARTVVDPTGAGDVLLAAWLAARLCAPAAAGWRQLALAAAAASLSVEGVGLAGVAPLGAVGDLLRSGGAPGG